MTCPHKTDGSCGIACAMADAPAVQCADDAERTCLAKHPTVTIDAPGTVAFSLASGWVRKNRPDDYAEWDAQYGKHREVILPPPRVAQLTKPASGAGAELLAIFKAMGVVSCQLCYALAATMDVWGVAECRKRIDEIALDILPRAKQWLKENRPVMAWASDNKVGDVVILAKLRGWVMEAIDAAEAKQWPIQPLGPVEYRSNAERDAIAKMVAPNMRRPVWRGGILQVWVTRACDKACWGCTQGSNLGGRPGMMTPEQFDAAVASLSGYPGVVGMFGGNPAVHPQFDELCKILRSRVPFEQRGLWCNNLNGRGAVAGITFNPAVSNLNVHMDARAHSEFAETWPESAPYLKGLDQDSRHSPPFVALQDVIADESQRWNLIGDCDINRNWSAMIGVVRGELRGYFCEIAGAQAMLHQDNSNWNGTGQPMPDTGVPIVPGWWNQPMTAFIDQARLHCHACGVPLRGRGALACSGDAEQFSRTHDFIARPKRRDVGVQLVTLERELSGHVPRVTDYIENGAL